MSTPKTARCPKCDAAPICCRVTFTPETHTTESGTVRIRRDPEVLIRCSARCCPAVAEARTVRDATKAWNSYAAGYAKEGE